MWTFKPGYLGVSIAVIALLGGVLLGSVLNVSSHNESTTKYDYVSDISGLFDVSNEPQYIDFNPATNYTGYTNMLYDINDPSGVSFDHSTVSNNYRMVTKLGTTEAGPSGTINKYSNYPTPSIEGLNTYHAPLGPQIGNIYTTAYEFKYTTVYDFLHAHFGPLSQYSQIEINLNWSDPTTRHMAWISYGYNSSTGDYTFSYPYSISEGLCSRFIINTQDLTIRGYNSQGNPWHTAFYSIYDYYICYGEGTTRTYSSGSTSYGTCDLSLNYTSIVTYAPTYAYMVPSSGVYNSSVATLWDNDTNTTQYDNQSIKLVFGPRFDNGAWSMPAGQDVLHIDGAGGTVKPAIDYSTADKWRFLSVYNDADTSVTIGDFKAIVLQLDKTASGLNWTVYGVTSFTSYTDLVISPIASASGSYTGDITLDSIMFEKSNGNGVTWSVYNTKVFMDTYGAVLVDPSINLADYWPDMSSYRYAFQSFALYGDSITMNGVTYPVVNEKITINEKEYKLNNFYLSFSEQGDTSITFRDVNKTLSLGATVDKVVSFAGNWGFKVGLYEGHTDVKKVYDWNVKLLGDNLNTIFLIAGGLAVALMLICKWLGASFKMTDKLVLGGAGLLMLLMLVV